ncbi:MAG: iron-containing redox enzyme family protein [Actinomycetota bacterium]|nr:iron-containing redox enzyme family protein [Actinomycetota bacterium]
MRLPKSRGPLSEFLIDHLSGPPRGAAGPSVRPADPLGDDDLHLALYIAYELHYRGFDDVDETWEWEPSIISFRTELETYFEEALRQVVGRIDISAPDVPGALQDLSQANGGPSLAHFVESSASLENVREFLIHRSIYHLREADSHTWALPRLSGRTKAALVEIQMDEYGSGLEERMHASLFRDTLEALGLETTYGAYIDVVPGVTLATVNLMSLFGLHRRWRGACVGHLALFEMTSTDPNRRYGRGLRRLGYGVNATRFFDEHVEADAIHEVIAANDLAGTLASESQTMAETVLFGARSLDVLDTRFAQHLLQTWQKGETSLLERHPSPTGS